MERTRAEWERLLTWAEDRREIKNTMGIFSNALMLFLDEDMEEIWSGRDDICLGLNNGWYPGKSKVAEYFSVKRENDRKKAEVLLKLFPDYLGSDKSAEDLKGLGVLEEKPMADPVIEIAGDRKTAKGVWYSHGSFSDITPRGPLAFWTFGVFAVDFIYEDEQWKIWHMLYLEDIKSPVSLSFAAQDMERFPLLDEFEELSALKDAEPAVSAMLREYYRPDRPFAKLIDLPQPYETFDDTFSYGYKEA